MPKKRVHEIAKEQGLTSKQVLEAFKDAGVYVKAASSTVEERDVRRAFPNGAPKKAAEPPKEEKKAAAKADDPAPVAETPAAERTEDGKAKVPRARAIKGAATKKAEEAPAKPKAAPKPKPKPKAKPVEEPAPVEEPVVDAAPEPVAEEPAP